MVWGRGHIGKAIKKAGVTRPLVFLVQLLLIIIPHIAVYLPRATVIFPQQQVFSSSNLITLIIETDPVTVVDSQIPHAENFIINQVQTSKA